MVKFAEEVKILATSETSELLKAAMEVKREGAGCSEVSTSEATSSEVTRG